jgi:hypothetical protein
MVASSHGSGAPGYLSVSIFLIKLGHLSLGKDSHRYLIPHARNPTRYRFLVLKISTAQTQPLSNLFKPSCRIRRGQLNLTLPSLDSLDKNDPQAQLVLVPDQALLAPVALPVLQKKPAANRRWPACHMEDKPEGSQDLDQKCSPLVKAQERSEKMLDVSLKSGCINDWRHGK